MFPSAKPKIPFRLILLHGWWPSFAKKILYRLRGYRIGKDVSLGFGSVIWARDVEIGDGVKLGFCGILQGRKIRLGNRVRIGAMCIVDTPTFCIGDDSKFNEQVFVGGLQSPKSELIIGRHSQVQQMTFINPAVSVTIGDETSIGGHGLIFGHQSWLSVLDGYSADYRPVVIGNKVGVAWRVFMRAAKDW